MTTCVENFENSVGRDYITSDGRARSNYNKNFSAISLRRTRSSEFIENHDSFSRVNSTFTIHAKRPTES